MNLYSRPQLSHSSSDLDEFQPEGIKLRPGKLATSKMQPAERMQKHIRHRVEKQAKLIGLKAIAGGPIGEKMRLVFLDEKLHRSSSAVDGLVDKAPVPVLQIGHHKSHILPESVIVDLDDNPLLPPASSSPDRTPHQTPSLVASPERILCVLPPQALLPFPAKDYRP